MLSVGDTLVPLIFITNGTHLTNFAGDTRVWPVYTTIGNLCSKIHQMASMQNTVMIALLKIPIKNCHIPQKLLDMEQQSKSEVLNQVLRQGIQPPSCQHNHSTESISYNVLCANVNFGHRKLILVAWIADCCECSDQYHIEQQVCFWYECPNITWLYR